MSSFLRRKGAPADLLELEYVLALHSHRMGDNKNIGKSSSSSTDNSTANSSQAAMTIGEESIALFLRSRHGIEVSCENLRSENFFDWLGLSSSRERIESRDLATSTSEASHGHCCNIDLTEMVSLLLLPTLCKAAVVDSESNKNDNNSETTIPLVQPPPDLIEKVLSIIILDVGIVPSLEDEDNKNLPPRLSSSLLKEILLAYGEDELANDEELIRDMVRKVGSNGNDDNADGGVLLDASTFTKGLTADILPLWDVCDEERLRTNRQDVLAAGDRLGSDTDNDEKGDTVKGDDEKDSLEEPPTRNSISDTSIDRPSKNVAAEKSFRSFPSSSFIDFCSCRYDSKAIAFLLLLHFILLYFANHQLSSGSSDGPSTISELIQGLFPSCDRNDNQIRFGCLVWTNIVEWLLWFQFLWAGGLIYVGLGSLGNGIDVPNHQRKWGLGLAALFVGGTSWTIFLWRQNRFQEEKIDLVNWTYLLLANIIVALQIHLWIGAESLHRFWNQRRHKRGYQVQQLLGSRRLFRFLSSSGATFEAGLKRAASHKTNEMVKNALETHQDYSTIRDKANNNNNKPMENALLNFSLQESNTVKAGGFRWGYNMLFSGNLLVKEGIWLSARVMAINGAQWFVCALIVFLGVYFSRLILDEWEVAKENPLDYALFKAVTFFETEESLADMSIDTMEEYCDYIVDSSNFTAITDRNNETDPVLSQSATVCAAVWTNEDMVEYFEDKAASIFPTSRYMVEVPLIVAIVTAFLASLTSTAMFLPSVISINLQLRNGDVTFWQDTKESIVFQERLDLVTSILGCMFWSGFLSSVMFGAMFGALVFLFLWQVRVKS